MHTAPWYWCTVQDVMVGPREPHYCTVLREEPYKVRGPETLEEAAARYIAVERFIREELHGEYPEGKIGE